MESVDMDKLANASIEEIEAMMAGAENAQNPPAEESSESSASAPEQDVEQASSGQADTQAEPAKGNDKELNFAKLRTKTEALEREAQRLKEENERLAQRTYQAELPADHAEKVAGVEDRLKNIAAQFQEGDIGFEEMQRLNREAQAEKEQLLAAGIKAQIAKEMKEQQEAEAAQRAASEREATAKTWQETCEAFIAGKPDGLDYSTDNEKFNSFNTYVKALGSDPDNDGKPMEWFLQEAHTLTKAKYRVAASAPRAPEPGKPSMPFHSLSDVPGGALPARNEVEKLDQASGAELTNRFMNDPSKIDEYLATL